MSKLEKLTKLNDICLFVKDFNACRKFYTEKFGFIEKRLQPDSEHANYVEFEFQGTSVTMWQIDAVRELLGDDALKDLGHHYMIAVKVPTLQDVDDIDNELISRGVHCVRPAETYVFGSRAVYLSDDEGNIWEVFAWEEGNGPGLL